MANVPNFTFIQDQGVLDIIDAILEAAGPNFQPPHSSENQQYDGVKGNSDKLLQFQLPGGSKMQGMSNPALFGDIGMAINTLMMILSPFVSAYSLLLPIIGVIRGIIEIICAMMNPFAMIAAIIRFFRKWLPPFLSLFPPFAGTALIISVIKVIMSLIFYILTVVVPTVQLIVDCFVKLFDVLNSITPPDIKQIQLDGIETKLENIIDMLVQKIGLLSVLFPIVEIIFLILRLITGFPCGNDSNSDIGLVGFGNELGLDSTCCECVDILSNRDSRPEGVGILLPGAFGDCPPGLVFNLFTSNQDVVEFSTYVQSVQEQLACQLDEGINYALPTGATGDRSLVKVRLTSRRGPLLELVLPVLAINGTIIQVISPLAILFQGDVNYRVEPDYDMLVMENIITAGCHPDVIDAKANIQSIFGDVNKSALDIIPDAASVQDDLLKLFDDLNACVLGLRSCIDSALARTSTDELQEDIDCANDQQTCLIDVLNGGLDSLTVKLNNILANVTNSSLSILDVDKRVVRADYNDFATISVVPRDITGTRLARSLPNNVSINIEVISDFGDLSNQQLDTTTGTITAELRSRKAGRATISAKVNGDFIVDRNEAGATSTRTRIVDFTQDAILPTRRRRSKPSSGKAINTGVGSDRGPSNK